MVPLKHRWRVDFLWLCGLTFGRWWALLRQERFDVDAVYAHRAALITLMSLANSVLCAVERTAWASRVAAVGTVAAPVFVLGHWRHGTTHLHNLLAQDPQFSFPTTFACANPSTFLVTERLGSAVLAPLLPGARPQDAMRLSFELPQEDEYAIGLLSLVSPHFALDFPRDEARFAAQLTLKGASALERERWKQALLYFVRKLAARDRRPLVLKSPPHTGRVELLLQLFPDARFVHIHRDPYEVFSSTRHLFDTSIWFMYLQRPDLTRRDDRILDWYTSMYDAWFADRALIPPGRLVEVAFADLDDDPLGTLKTIYDQLRLGEVPLPRVSAYLDSVEDHVRNVYRPLTTAERGRVATCWERSFREWGYPT